MGLTIAAFLQINGDSIEQALARHISLINKGAKLWFPKEGGNTAILTTKPMGRGWVPCSISFKKDRA